MSQFKPRFNRSRPRVVKASDLKGYNGKSGGYRASGHFSSDQGIHWRPISMKTLGFLAATGKISIIQVHSLMGDRSNKTFRDSFLDSVDLRQPTDKDMHQIGLFSHLLF